MKSSSWISPGRLYHADGHKLVLASKRFDKAYIITEYLFRHIYRFGLTTNVRLWLSILSQTKPTLAQIAEKNNELFFPFFHRILANYIVWNVIQDEVSFLSKPYRKARTQYRERVLGSKGQKKRWKTCVTFTNELLGDILGSAYVEHHFTKKSKKMVREEFNWWIFLFISMASYFLTRSIRNKNELSKICHK